MDLSDRLLFRLRLPRSIGRLISERPGGYLIELNGEKITYSDSRIRHSPDGVYHWCSQNGRDDTRTICLFVPPNSF